MRNIRLLISYDGAGFFGSQSQPGRATVQDQLKKAIQGLTGEKVVLTFAGRTDRGVHGLFQSANFKTSSSVPAENFPRALNSRLSGIEVLDADEKPKGFSSRFNARKREYTYFLYSGEHVPVIFWGKVLKVRGRLDAKKMKAAARQFIGRHDFVNFCAKDEAQKFTKRRIYKVEIGTVGKDILKKLRFKGTLIYIRIIADSFLYKMVRFIVGTLIDAGKGKVQIDQIKELVNGKVKRVRSSVVHPCGLYLSEVKY